MLKNLIAKIERQSNNKVTNIVSDNGTEFQNPFAERGNRTTTNKARCLLKDFGIDPSLWDKAANTAVYLENLRPSKNINFDTPLKKWFNREPSLKHLQPFGCLAISLKRKLNRTGNVKITHYVKFLPNEFPSLKPKSTSTNHKSFVLNPSTEQSLSNEEPIAAQITLPVHKGYSWVTEKESIPQNNIFGDVGNPEAVNGPNTQEWKEAIKSELKNMMNHHVWTPTISNQNVKPLSTTWVFKRKTDEDGNLSKVKARLCVRGLSQKEGINYTEVFSPTGRLSSLRLLLTLCHINHYPIEQIDVQCALLNSKPEEKLYIHKPLGYKYYPDKDVFLLKKSLYGLKQSPCFWHKVPKNTLVTIGLVPCFTDSCLDYSQNKEHPLWLFVHVDDLIFGGTWNKTFKIKIKTFFEMEDLGTVKYALGIRINQNKEYILLVQDRFIHQILTEFSINQVKPPMGPLPSNYKELKSPESNIKIPPPFSFRRSLGLLQYIFQCTRPDLSFTTSFLSQFLENPKDKHYKALIHTLKYLSGTQNFTFKLGSNLMSHSKTQIFGFTDSDLGGGTEKKSFSVSLIYFFGALGWRAHNQKVVALSSAEAKYNAPTKSMQDLAWTKQLIFELTNKEMSCTLHSDNKSAIAIASNPVYHHGT
ncbi:hypothetical protein O181_057134 [Austropuccinia psidii MF-1]|uniref:Reverse transcriptase Ty1/copia-type domain-containing protein n=1 Tax=Austropuccinia psidii MF-1 TaxID=1389203 RepID=A0A9Q3HWD7_9BASI|nr:hypothetical protein [Austropuccinia psidii MF-1]